MRGSVPRRYLTSALLFGLNRAAFIEVKDQLKNAGLLRISDIMCLSGIAKPHYVRGSAPGRPLACFLELLTLRCYNEVTDPYILERKYNFILHGNICMSKANHHRMLYSPTSAC